jgi:SAM-dependent methyltransferase
MPAFSRIKTLLRDQGPRAAVAKFCVLCADRLFDIKYGTDTCAFAETDELTIGSKNKKSGNSYQPTRGMPLRKLLKFLKPALPTDSVLVDFGCGKGRVLFIASEYGFKAVRGIEFARELAAAAEKNRAAFQAKSGIRAEIKIVEGDVTDYTINPDENVFFMFNPFDAAILGKVLSNITTSLQNKPRNIWIIYHHPKCAEVIEQQGHFTRLHKLSFWGYEFTVYSNVKS